MRMSNFLQGLIANSLFGIVLMTRSLHIRIEMVADLVCPYCYIGFHRVQTFLAKLPSDTNKLSSVTLLHVPYILRPSLPSQGVSKRKVFLEQFGSSEKAAAVFEGVAAEARRDGLCFDFEDMQAGNSEVGHQAVLRAGESEHDLAVAILMHKSDHNEDRTVARGLNVTRAGLAVTALYQAYNCERRWIGDETVVVDILKDHLQTTRHGSELDQYDLTKRGRRLLSRSGSNGVPHWVVTAYRDQNIVKVIEMHGAVHIVQWEDAFRELVRSREEL